MKPLPSGPHSFALLAVATSLVACNDTSATCDAGCTDANTPITVSGGGCDTSKPPGQGGCDVADTDGFFVSPAGSDSANGSKAAPFVTIGAGILAAAAAPLKPNVYVCKGTYPEKLVVQNSAAGVALHGGFDCTTWAQTNAPTTVSPPYASSATPNYVFQVLGTSALVESMTLTAPDATDPGVSSIAAFLNGAPAVTFRRATVTGGVGADGVSPTALAGLSANTSGNNGTTSVGGALQDCKCSSDDSIGGQGGTAVGDGGAPMNGSPAINGVNGGQAGTTSSCAAGDGANGLPAGNGASATIVGILSVNGWSPSAGTEGSTGGTAQGGGGGYWNLGNGVGGGGGACGGCGGAGGLGGGGGGGSMAVASLNTQTLRIRSSTFTAAKGGNGGDGVVGQPGQPGGAKGMSFDGICNGGNGGTGGLGGTSGGGAGGVSVAIATVGSQLDIDNQTTVLAGAAGHGGHDATTQAVKAIDGFAAATHDFTN